MPKQEIIFEITKTTEPGSAYLLQWVTGPQVVARDDNGTMVIDIEDLIPKITSYAYTSLANAKRKAAHHVNRKWLTWTEVVDEDDDTKHWRASAKV